MTFGFAFVEGKSLKTTIGGKGGKKYEIDSDIDEFRDLCDDLRKNKEKSIIILKGTFEFEKAEKSGDAVFKIPSNCTCLLYTSPSPRDATLSRMPSSA